MTCKEVARLASESLDRQLGLRERLLMRLHLLRCKSCSRYVGQLRFLQRACAEADERADREVSLSGDARKRIQSRLRQGKSS